MWPVTRKKIWSQMKQPLLLLLLLLQSGFCWIKTIIQHLFTAEGFHCDQISSLKTSQDNMMVARVQIAQYLESETWTFNTHAHYLFETCPWDFKTSVWICVTEISSSVTILRSWNNYHLTGNIKILPKAFSAALRSCGFGVTNPLSIYLQCTVTQKIQFVTMPITSLQRQP